MSKRDILTEFQAYYQSLSPDAQEIIRRLVLVAPKSQPAAPRAPRASRSASKRGLPSGQVIETEKETVSSVAASGGGD